MGTLVFYVVTAVLLILLFLKLLLPEGSRFRSHRNEELAINDFLPTHQREFEEVEHRLLEYDDLLEKINSERREVALGYLDALRDDFLRVEELLNRAAKFLPALTLRGEGERLWVGLKFRFDYRIARLWIRAGLAPAVGLKSLTRQVQTLADWADKTLAVIAREPGLRALQSELNK